MKFGKLLLRSISLSVHAWSSKWLDYKLLKKMLNAIVDEQIERPPQATPSTAGALAEGLASSVSEVAFFRQLNDELRRVAEFYVELEARVAAHYAQLHASVREYIAGSGAVAARASEGSRIMMVAVKLYMSSVQLENYAVMNYCGFGKILKKHDKLSRYPTKAAYMARLVNCQAFAQYRRLRRVIVSTERLYAMLTDIVPIDTWGGGAAAPSDGSDARGAAGPNSSGVANGASSGGGRTGLMDSEDAERLAELREVKAGLQLHRAKEADEAAAALGGLVEDARSDGDALHNTLGASRPSGQHAQLRNNMADGNASIGIAAGFKRPRESTDDYEEESTAGNGASITRSSSELAIAAILVGADQPRIQRS